jgi:hypothetical protein
VNLSPIEKNRLLKLAAAVCAFGFATLRPIQAADAADSASGSGIGGDQVVRLNEMEVFTSPTSALTQSPADSKLDALEPNTVISAQTINNQIAPTADYAKSRRSPRA